MPPVALTIAGSDSGGGAGIQADLKTFERFHVFGTSAITAITAQNTRGVTRWAPIAPALIRAQIEAVAEDLRPTAVKSGMLGTAGAVRAVARAIVAQDLHPYVLDPVLAATTGRRLLTRDGVAAVRRMLLPLADLVTPNLDEAEMLIGEPVRDLAGMRRAARVLVDRGRARAALVTGGHLPGDVIFDVLYDGTGAPSVFRSQRLSSRHTHGTGCTLSAAIAAHLALEHSLASAVRRARAYVRHAIRHAPGLGAGRGPLGHHA